MEMLSKVMGWRNAVFVEKWGFKRKEEWERSEVFILTFSPRLPVRRSRSRHKKRSEREAAWETRFQPTTLRGIDAYTRDSEVTCLNCLKCLEMALPGRKSEPPRERGVQSSDGHQGICDKKQGLMWWMKK
jgi:hypothetical protein